MGSKGQRGFHSVLFFLTPLFTRVSKLTHLKYTSAGTPRSSMLGIFSSSTEEVEVVLGEMASVSTVGGSATALVGEK